LLVQRGESIDVDLTIDSAKLTVTPTSKYEEGKYYLYISYKMIITSSGKLEECIVMRFRIE